MGGDRHNGVAENAINNVVRIARTMMIHAAMMRPDSSEKSLFPMDMHHAVHLHNHTHHISIGVSA